MRTRIETPSWCKRASIAAALTLALLSPAATSAQNADREAGQDPPAPVVLGGEPVVWITRGAGPYSPAYRADRISQRLQEITRDTTLRDPTVTITEADGASELRIGARPIMVITARDALDLGAPRLTLAGQYAAVIERAVRDERMRYAPAALIRSGRYGLLATIAFFLFVWVVLRGTRALARKIQRQIEQPSAAMRAIERAFVSADRLATIVRRSLALLRIVAIGIVADLYLTFVLGLFPWTRAISHKLLGYVFAPVSSFALSVVNYVPKFLFLIVIVGAVTFAIRIVGAFFRQVQAGRIQFSGFPPEWADPTNKIARALLMAFGAVVAFPYLPASGSPAFAGVSVFVGVLVSLASSSALSNTIAGLVLTYTGAFRLGDRVRIGDAFGDIIETSLLATRVRTIKNEEVTIPNSIALGTAVTNYTRESQTRGLILHTTVTIGYETPWRQVHDLLVEAALATSGILPTPRPFVWQTALNDFYATYEINAYTASPQNMVDTYAALHARIQDAFYAAGVEIMSPHYTSLRDGNTVAIPEAFRAAGYQPKAFRVENTETPVGAAAGAVTVRRP